MFCSRSHIFQEVSALVASIVFVNTLVNVNKLYVQVVDSALVADGIAGVANCLFVEEALEDQWFTGGLDSILE